MAKPEKEAGRLKEPGNEEPKYSCVCEIKEDERKSLHLLLTFCVAWLSFIRAATRHCLSLDYFATRFLVASKEQTITIHISM